MTQSIELLDLVVIQIASSLVRELEHLNTLGRDEKFLFDYARRRTAGACFCFCRSRNGCRAMEFPIQLVIRTGDPLRSVHGTKSKRALRPLGAWSALQAQLSWHLLLHSLASI